MMRSMKRSTVHPVRLVFRALAVLAILLGGTLPLIARTYRVDPAKTEIAFEIGAKGYPLTHGVFRRFTSSLAIDVERPQRSSVRFEVASDSLDTRSPALDAYVRGPVFLDAASYPTIRFVSTSVEKLGDHTVRVTGDLTLLGVTRPETFVVEVDPGAGSSFSLRAAGDVRRSAFGMKSALPLVSDDVRILVSTRADAL